MCETRLTQTVFKWRCTLTGGQSRTTGQKKQVSIFSYLRHSIWKWLSRPCGQEYTSLCNAFMHGRYVAHITIWTGRFRVLILPSAPTCLTLGCLVGRILSHEMHKRAQGIAGTSHMECSVIIRTVNSLRFHFPFTRLCGRGSIIRPTHTGARRSTDTRTRRTTPG